MNRFLFILASIISLSPLTAQERDSLRTTRAEDITVTDEREKTEYVIPSLPVLSESAPRLVRQSGSTRASDFIRLLSPSLALRTYGTLGGITLSGYRGLPPEYTVVFRDGIRLTNEQNSLTDLGRLTAVSLERVELLPPTSAILLGGDAIAASVNLITLKPQRSSLSVGSSIATHDQGESFAERQYTASATYQVNDAFGMSAAVDHQFSKGDFVYRDRFNGSEVRRANNDASLTEAAVTGSWHSESTTVDLVTNYVRAFRGAPGATVIENVGASSLTARQNDEDVFALARMHTSLSDDWTIEPAIAAQSQYEEYKNPDLDIEGRYRNQIYFAETKVHGPLVGGLDLYTGLQLQQNRLLSNQNSASVARDSGSLGDTAASRLRAGYYAALDLKLLNELKLVASARTEYISDLNSLELLPQAFLKYDLPQGLAVSVGYGKSYHAPTFNQLYWKTLGNTDLRSERGSNLEASLEWLFTPEHTFSSITRITGFQAEVRDQILWLPQQNGQYRPVNVQNARTRGVELRFVSGFKISDEWRTDLDLAYTYIDASNRTAGLEDKRLPYTAETQSLVRWETSWQSAGSLTLVAHYRGKRFSDVSNTKLSALPPVSTIDLSIQSNSLPLSNAIGAQFRLAVTNLADTYYFEVPNYPLPGRVIRLGLDLLFATK